MAKILRRVFGNNPRLLNGLSLISQGIDAIFFDTVHTPQYLRTPAEQLADFGINVAGFVKGEFGLGAAARATIKAMEAADIPYVVNNIEAPGHSHLDDTVKNFSLANPYSVNLIHVNAAETTWFHHVRWHDCLQNKYNIGYWFWELSRFPEEWFASFRYYDEIWVASNFCLGALSKVSPLPVVKISCVHIDESAINGDRSRFGLAEDSYVFLFIFDFHGYFKRKNPIALVQAFKMEFQDNEDATLVLKCINSAYYPREYETLRKAASEANVKIIDAHLRKDDLYSLVAACDCYVSLHRGEGFGLPIAEAMYLGKPAIATGYSGNMDFMNVNNSFPVKYKLVEVGEKEYCLSFKKGYAWAEPDVSHAAELMRFVYENREHAASLGRQASNDIRASLSPAIAGQEIRRRLNLIIERTNRGGN